MKENQNYGPQSHYMQCVENKKSKKKRAKDRTRAACAVGKRITISAIGIYVKRRPETRLIYLR
jgi:hypothetical protein